MGEALSRGEIQRLGIAMNLAWPKNSKEVTATGETEREARSEMWMEAGSHRPCVKNAEGCVAAVMYYYKLGGLKQPKIFISQFWRPEI